MNGDNLATFRITRRLVAVVVFINGRLDYAEERHLSSFPEKAGDSAIGFVRWVLATFAISSAALEQVAGENRRAQLSRSVVAVLKQEAVAVWGVSKKELFEAFGIPPVTTRKELRAIAASFWPVLSTRNGEGTTLDAAALGIYIETQRLFPH